MKIGIDCDGVLTDLASYMYSYGEKYFKYKPVNPEGCTITDIFACTEKDELRFGMKYFFYYCKNWPPRENAVDVISKLKADGYYLYQITARKFITKNNPLGWYSKWIHRAWMKKHKFTFDEVHYCAESTVCEDKLNACKRLGVEIMIEDTPDVAVYLAENHINVLLFDAPYNRNINFYNIKRVYSWKEIYEYILSTYSYSFNIQK